MTSPTQHVEAVRKHKARHANVARRRKLRKGTTPRFPIHIEDNPELLLPQPPRSGDKD